MLTLEQFAEEISEKRIGNRKLARIGMRIGMLLERESKKAIRNNPVTNRKIGKPKQGLIENGHLLNSIRTKYEPSDTQVIVTLGSYGLPYGAIHEFGGLIKAKKKWLTIPNHPTSKGLRVRNYPKKLFRPRNKTGGFYNVLAFQKKKATKKNKAVIQVVYALKKSVKIPPRPYLALALQRSEDKINQILSKVFGEK
jgi:phage gpG-like protein